jgi:hypothetical protein
MSGPILLCSVGLVEIGNAQVIGRIPYPGLQGCVPHQEWTALRIDRQILLAQVLKAPVLGMDRQIGRPRWFEACRAHGYNLYGYGGSVLKIWYLKIAKVHIFKSI